MDQSDNVGDIAAASRSCIIAFEGLVQHRSSGSTLHNEPISAHIPVAKVVDNADQRDTSPHRDLESMVSGFRGPWEPSGLDEAFWNDVDNICARFRVWAANLGALQRGSSSLDVRLRDLGIMRMAILQILKGIQSTLVECK